MAKMSGTFCEMTPHPKRMFDRSSFRWKKSGSSWVLVGCPRGNFGGRRCHVGLRAHKILVPTSRTDCSHGKLIKKG